MTKLVATALSVAFACIVWTVFCTLTGFPSWIGFVGCTSYFAAGAGKQGGINALCSNWTGIFWAMMVSLLYQTGMMQNSAVALVVGALAVGFIAGAMVLQSKISVLVSIPSSFMGCFSTFAANGDWKTMLVGVTLGVGLGFLCDYPGRFLYKLFGAVEAATEKVEAAVEKVEAAVEDAVKAPERDA